MTDKHDKSSQDFQSLMTTPDYDVAEAAKREREAKRQRTDFQGLKEEMPDDPRRYSRRSATDMIIDALTPLLIFAMVYSLVFFLLDVRFIYSEVHIQNLRLFAFCMVMGVVALNRMVARDGSEESMMYIIALVLVVGFYTALTTGIYDVGSVAPGFLDRPGTAALFNMTFVGLLWWATNRLTHECCIDENRTAGDIGILTGTVRKFQLSIRRGATLNKKTSSAAPAKKKSASRAPVGFLMEADEIEAIDPLEYKPPEADKPAKAPREAPSKRLERHHPGVSIFYFSVPAMAAFALGLPVLMRGGPAFIRSGHVYVAVFTVSALSLLMLTSLGGLRQYFRSRRIEFPAAIGWFWVGLGSVMIAAVMTGALQLPLPELPKAALIESHQYDPWSRNSSFELVLSPASKTADLVEQTRIVERVGQAVLVCMGLFLLFAGARAVGALAVSIGRNRDWYPDWVIDLFNGLDRFLERVIRVPQLPKRRGPTRISPAVAMSTPFRNPMAGEGGGGRSPKVRNYVAVSYDALCALAADLGVPRHADQTPYEFVKAFPRELRGLRREARELTEMYVRSAYSEEPLDEKALDRLRKFWMAYEKVRGRYIR
ncbi:MAG: DUF4129 domain-containing protein [Candidatus Hydrogenedentes bacterium]|nr:DUF4129 domain-containing protein [Candidatus Hydrogenedentota bacterium]